MEHASIAAFARFALELLSLGAPGSALVETSAAIADETAHAHAAFRLASAYAGREIGPLALSVEGALDAGATSDRAVFATLVREGCVGETVAAIEATAALQNAEDSAVRDVLARIAGDETRHAALAWRTASWLVARGDAAFRDWAKQELDVAIAERNEVALAASSDSTDVARDARAHGLLSAREAGELARAAIRGAIAPCATAMFAKVNPLNEAVEAARRTAPPSGIPANHARETA